MNHSFQDAAVEHAQTPSGTTSSPESEKTLGQYIPLLYHYNMLQDEDRVGAFKQAIELIVQPGMHVVELGGGTGILSSLAARRGARVTCVERNPELIVKSNEFLRLNSLADDVTVVAEDATGFVPDRPVDVVICEMLHSGLLREKQASVIAAFKRNYIAQFGRAKLPVFIPEATILMIQLLEQSFDFSGYEAPVPMFQAPTAIQPRTIELSTLLPYANLAYGHTIPKHFIFDESLTTNQAGHFNAIRLVTQNVLGIDEEKQQAITWANQHLVLPIPNPRDLKTNDSVRVQFNYEVGDSVDQFDASLRVE